MNLPRYIQNLDAISIPFVLQPTPSSVPITFNGDVYFVSGPHTIRKPVRSVLIGDPFNTLWNIVKDHTPEPGQETCSFMLMLPDRSDYDLIETGRGFNTARNAGAKATGFVVGDLVMRGLTFCGMYEKYMVVAIDSFSDVRTDASVSYLSPVAVPAEPGVPTLGMGYNRDMFLRDIAMVINRHSRENSSNTPDFILAQVVDDALTAFEEGVKRRAEWHRPSLDQAA